MNLTALPDGHAARYSHRVTYADRRNGELKNIQRLQRLQAVADRVPNGVCASHGSMAQLSSGDARQGNSTSWEPMNRAAVNTDQSAAASAVDADHRQAEYFLRLLAQGCLCVDQQIDRYQKAIAIAEASGAVDHARRLRRAMRIEQRERQTLEGLIDRLQQRFPLPPVA